VAERVGFGPRNPRSSIHAGFSWVGFVFVPSNVPSGRRLGLSIALMIGALKGCKRTYIRLSDVATLNT